MDRLNQYRELIKNLLAEDARLKLSAGDIEPLIVFDDERSSYHLMYVGWSGKYRYRTHGSVVHARLKDGKIWIEEDGMQEGFANVLLKAGVPKEDIVLGFLPPSKRKYEEFAVA